MTPLLTILLASGAAFFYMAASWMMKEWGAAAPFAVVVPTVLVTLAVGAWFETEVLKFSRLGHIIVLVLAIELVMTFFVAILVLRESYSPREIAAVTVIIAGIAILSWPAAPGQAPSPVANSRTGR